MKSVIISIKPRWCELIASGKKTVEIRKTRPKLDLPFKVYIYCTKEFKPNSRYGFKLWAGRGKVIGEFICAKASSYDYAEMYEPPDWEKSLGNQYYITSGELESSCLSYEELEMYGNGKKLYGWHISDLVIYDKPKLLTDFVMRECLWENIRNNRCIDASNEQCLDCRLKRPPQSWCYVEEDPR